MHLPHGGGTSTFPDPPGVADFHCWCQWPWPHDAGTQPPCPARPGPGQPLGVPNPCGRSQVSRPRTPAPPIFLPLPRQHINNWPDGPVHIPALTTGVPNPKVRRQFHSSRRRHPTFPRSYPRPACPITLLGLPTGVPDQSGRRQCICPTTPLHPIPPQLPRRNPGNWPGWARQNTSSTSRRLQPKCPASIHLPYDAGTPTSPGPATPAT